MRCDCILIFWDWNQQRTLIVGCEYKNFTSKKKILEIYTSINWNYEIWEILSAVHALINSVRNFSNIQNYEYET